MSDYEYDGAYLHRSDQNYQPSTINNQPSLDIFILLVMAADVRLHGDMVEFLLSQRCEACRQRDGKCLIQQRDERCLLCADADRPCIFTRTIVVTGARTGFEWDVLLGGELVASVNQDHRAMAGYAFVFSIESCLNTCC